MKLVKRSGVTKNPLPGRVLQLVVGQSGAVSPSDVITYGYATYSGESGPMAPHHHVEEIVYILESVNGYVRFGGKGEEPNELGDRIPLEAGMTLHFPDQEWHVFEYEPGGFVDILFFYAHPDVYNKNY